MFNYGVFIPVNKYDIGKGYYTINQIVDLLRDYKNNPEIIQFLADMLEE
jgi:hypothetical protein